MKQKTSLLPLEAEHKIDNEEPTRERPAIEEWHGLKFSENKTMKLKDGRYRTRMVLFRPGTEEPMSEKVTIHARSEEDLEEKKEKMRFVLAMEYMEEIFEMIRSGQYLNAPFGLYYLLRYDLVREKKKWAGKKEEYDKLWQEVLSPRFETIPIRDLLFPGGASVVMNEIFSHDRHKKTSTDEQTCWILLDGFFDMLAEEKISQINPIKEIAARHRHSMSEDIFMRLSARSLSNNELIGYVEACMCIENSSLRTCLLLHVLMGLTVYELCGLNVGSVAHMGALSWLEIEREYWQKRGQKAIITEMLNSANQYRRVVCTEVIECFLKKHIKLRKAEGAKNNDPLFVWGGERLSPQIVKEKETQLLDLKMDAGMNIAYEGRGKPHKESRDRSRGDIPRSTAVYHYFYTAHMTRSEISAMCGIDRIHTYAVWYVDWNNREVMQYMKDKISLWHNGLFRLTKNHKEARPTSWQGEREALCIFGKAQPGGTLELRAPYGVECGLKEMR